MKHVLKHCDDPGEWLDPESDEERTDREREAKSRLEVNALREALDDMRDQRNAAERRATERVQFAEMQRDAAVVVRDEAEARMLAAERRAEAYREALERAASALELLGVAIGPHQHEMRSHVLESAAAVREAMGASTESGNRSSHAHSPETQAIAFIDLALSNVREASVSLPPARGKEVSDWASKEALYNSGEGVTMTTPTITRAEFLADSRKAFALADEHGACIIIGDDGKPSGIVSHPSDDRPLPEDFDALRSQLSASQERERLLRIALSVLTDGASADASVPRDVAEAEGVGARKP